MHFLSKNNFCFFILILTIALFSIYNNLMAQRTELPEKRSFFSNTYRNADGSLTTKICLAPVNYRDANDQMQPINSEIVPSDNDEYDYEVTRGLYHIYIKNDLISDNPVVFETKDGTNLKMKLTAITYFDVSSKEYHIIENIQASTPTVTKNRMEFSNVFNSIDLRYIYKETRLKEEILMSQAARDNLPDPSIYGINYNNAYIMFLIELDMDSAPEAYANNNRIKKQTYEGYDHIMFRNLHGDVKFFLPIDWAFRDVDRDSLHEDIMLKIKKRTFYSEGKHYLLSGVRLKKLQQMPEGTIVFDPQVELTFQPGSDTGKDSYIYQTYENNYGERTNLLVSKLYRIILEFDLGVIPSTANINSATLSLYNYSTCIDVPLEVSDDLRIHRVTHEWSEGTGNGTNTGDGVTYTTYNGSELWASAGGDYETESLTTLELDANSDKWRKFVGSNFTNCVQKFVDGSYKNYGWIIKWNDLGPCNGAYFYFYSSDHSDDFYRPRLDITYTTGGDVTYYVRDAAGNVIATYKR